jgi:hypothetical protein
MQKWALLILSLAGRSLLGIKLFWPLLKLGKLTVVQAKPQGLQNGCLSAIPASALDEEDEDEDDEPVGDTRDDERSGTRYNVSSLQHHTDIRFHADWYNL